VKIDLRKGLASVSIGAMKWDVAIEELIPQLVKPPEPSIARGEKPRSRQSDRGPGSSRIDS
jgi:hypothetical protein